MLKIKNLHLLVSTLILIPVALAYGVNPKLVLPLFFDFKVESIDLTNIFRVLMVLYFGISAILIKGMHDEKYWLTATVLNMAFMGSLGFGRLLSMMLDGLPSTLFIVGFFGETILGVWSFINLKKYKN